MKFRRLFRFCVLVFCVYTGLYAFHSMFIIPYAENVHGMETFRKISIWVHDQNRSSGIVHMSKEDLNSAQQSLDDLNDLQQSKENLNNLHASKDDLYIIQQRNADLGNVQQSKDNLDSVVQSNTKLNIIQRSEENLDNIPVSKQELDVIQQLVNKDPGDFHDQDIREIENSTNHSNCSCKPVCKQGEFWLEGMVGCQPWLNCSQIHSQVHVIKYLTKGAIKKIYLAEWQDHKIVSVNVTTDDAGYRRTLRYNFNNFKSLSPNKEVTQVIGYCPGAPHGVLGYPMVLLTQYTSIGDLSKIEEHLTKYPALDTPVFRLAMCAKYAHVLDFLHNSPMGAQILCDSGGLGRLLSQYLITEDLTIAANDLESLKKPKDCFGYKGEFTAPEVRAPDIPNIEDVPISERPPGNVANDIWKIPDVCNHFMGASTEQLSNEIKENLLQLHKQCKNENPALRPNASEAYNSFIHILPDIQIHLDDKCKCTKYNN